MAGSSASARRDVVQCVDKERGMSDLWRVTYMGEGVKPTPVGAFAKYVTAFTTEDFARSVAGDADWVVADPAGNEVGSRSAPKAEKKAEEKKAEDKKPEPKAEKADDKKADDKKPEKADDKKADKKPEAAEKAEKK
jgi:hypothetical protein